MLFKEENNNSNTVFFSDVKEAKRFLEKEKDIAAFSTGKVSDEAIILMANAISMYNNNSNKK